MITLLRPYVHEYRYACSVPVLKVTDDESLLKLGYEKEINVYVVRKHGLIH